MSDDLEKQMQQFYKKLDEAQQPLSYEEKKIISDNRWELYEE